MDFGKSQKVTRDGRNLLLVALVDIDGTVNNESVAEKDRLQTIGAAKNAIEKLQEKGIAVGLITARSFGETLVYHKTLGTSGFTITEDGAVIILPASFAEPSTSLADKYRVVRHNGESAVILSAVEIATIKEFIYYVSKALKKNKLPSELITTCTSTPELLQELIDYASIEDTERAMDRLASAFVRNATQEQYSFMKKFADGWNIRVAGKRHHFHLIGKDADKGKAIKFLDSNIRFFLPDKELVDGILPIVFGNDYNDLRLFEAAHEMGGLGVIVKDARDRYKVEERSIPPYVIKAQGAYGYGMQEAVNRIFDKFKL